MPFGARYVHIIATCPPLAEGWGQAWGRGGSDRNDNLSFLSTRGALLLLFFFLKGRPVVVNFIVIFVDSW